MTAFFILLAMSLTGASVSFAGSTKGGGVPVNMLPPLNPRPLIPSNDFARLSRVLWRRSLGRGRIAFKILNEATLSRPTCQALLDGRLIVTSPRPILLTGAARSGKSLHLRALQNFLRIRGVPFVTINAQNHAPAYGVMKLGLTVTHSPDFDLPLTPAPKVSVKLGAGEAAVETTRAQILRATALMDYLEKNRWALKGHVVFIDTQIDEPEFLPVAHHPTTLNLLDRLVWLRHEDKTRFVIATRSDFLRDLSRRAAHQASDPFVLKEFEIVSLDEPLELPCARTARIER